MKEEEESMMTWASEGWREERRRLKKRMDVGAIVCL